MKSTFWICVWLAFILLTLNDIEHDLHRIADHYAPTLTEIKSQ